MTSTHTGNRVAEIAFHTPSRPCADIEVSLPGQETPSFRALLPERVTGCPYKGFFHTEPVTWHQGDDGAWLGAISFEGFGRIEISLVPHSYYVEIVWTLENRSTNPLPRTVLDFCFGVNNGGGDWANRAFLPQSQGVRAADGAYWHDQVAYEGTFVHSAGHWVNEPQAQLDASILVVANEAKDRFAFQMWDKPIVSTWVNDANACMHLRPTLSETLDVGEQVTIRGCMGISIVGLEQLWHLYQNISRSFP